MKKTNNICDALVAIFLVRLVRIMDKLLSFLNSLSFWDKWVVYLVIDASGFEYEPCMCSTSHSKS